MWGDNRLASKEPVEFSALLLCVPKLQFRTPRFAYLGHDISMQKKPQAPGGDDCAWG